MPSVVTARTSRSANGTRFETVVINRWISGYTPVEYHRSISSASTGANPATSASTMITKPRGFTRVRSGRRGNPFRMVLLVFNAGRCSRRFAEWFALLLEARLEALGAVARRARPVLRAVLVTAPAARVGILDGEQIEVRLPVRTFLLQRGGAEAGLHPLHRPIRQLARILHVVQVLVAGD